MAETNESLLYFDHIVSDVSEKSFNMKNCSEINNSNPDCNSVIHDPENTMVEDDKLKFLTSLGLTLSNGGGVTISDFNKENDIQTKGGEFHDAVQFFKNPSSLNFLENSGTSNTPTDSMITRSPCMNTDPLHANSQSVVKLNELQETGDEADEPKSGESPENESMLMSFDSLVTSKDSDSESVANAEPNKSQKLHTEEELQQALNIQELNMQGIFLKRQHDFELEMSQKKQKIEKRHLLCTSFNGTLKGVIDVACMLFNKQKKLQESLENVKNENSKLKGDLKTSIENLQSTISDLHKRHEECEKVYAQNQNILKEQLKTVNILLQQKCEMYKASQKMLHKAYIAVVNAKKSGNGQVAVLNAELQKAELEISKLNLQKKVM